MNSVEKKQNELKEWELRLSIKENEINKFKSKNINFIQSLQKQIDSLQKQLNEERNKNKKHTLSEEDLEDLHIIKRENSKLRATIIRMQDEIKYMQINTCIHSSENKENKENNKRHEINNYYINTINYNNIINNNSLMNLQNNNNNNLKWYPLSIQNEINEPENIKQNELKE
eukprot:238999_1